MYHFENGEETTMIMCENEGACFFMLLFRYVSLSFQLYYSVLYQLTAAEVFYFKIFHDLLISLLARVGITPDQV